MFIIKTVKPSEATGKTAEIYKTFPEGMPIPQTLEMLSASEDLLGFQAQAIGWWMEHSTLQPKLLASIRYLMSDSCSNEGCVTFNGGMLMSMGVSEAELETMKNDPLSGPLDKRENALLAFVMTAMNKPESVSENMVDELRSLDWSDKDIFEATYHAAGVLGPSAVAKALRKK